MYREDLNKQYIAEDLIVASKSCTVYFIKVVCL